MRETSSLKDLAVASALVVGCLPAIDTDVKSHGDIYVVLGIVLIVMWLFLKLTDLPRGD